jgi:hypothetical protein
MESNYLNPSLTDLETVKLIKEKIESNTPFALTRFGDGEIYILNRNASEHFLKKNLNEWGYNYPSQINEFYDDANTILKRSIVLSDVIGLMNPNCVIAKHINYKSSVWSLKKEDIVSFGADISKLKICNHMISRSEIMGSLQGFKNIIQGKSFHIISRNTNEMKNRKLEDLFNVKITYTHHPNNINFNNREDFISGFKDIKEDIVIMGVGLQKDYGIILRDNYGKIALDMGATMDAWSGIISRPWFNNGNLQDYLILKNN